MELPLLPLVLDDVPAALRTALEQEGLPLAEARTEQPAGRFVLWDSRRKPQARLADGQLAVDVDQLRQSSAVDPLAALADTRSSKRGWRLGSVLAVEDVARHDKREIRRQVVGAIRGIIETAGGVWLRISAYPYPYRSAFNFRLDHDGYQPDDFDAVLKAIEGHEHAVTHYICASTHADQPEALERLRGFDVGSHGYWHHSYQDERQNRLNIRRGIEALRAAGIEPSGFAAPHGRYTQSLPAVLDELGVTHSSEFGLTYDESPLTLPGRRALQIPIHPVCLGIALEGARADISQMMPSDIDVATLVTAHFREVALAKHAAGEPVFLYGHPDGRLGRYPQVLRETLQTCSGLSGMWQTTHSEFARWWRARSQARLRVVSHGGSWKVLVDHAPAGWRMAVELWRSDQMALIPLDSPAIDVVPESLKFEARPSPRFERGEIVRAPAGVRDRIARYLDWERETPLAELPGRTLRERLKRSLRRLRRQPALSTTR